MSFQTTPKYLKPTQNKTLQQHYQNFIRTNPRTPNKTVLQWLPGEKAIGRMGTDSPSQTSAWKPERRIMTNPIPLYWKHPRDIQKPSFGRGSPHNWVSRFGNLPPLHRCARWKASNVQFHGRPSVGILTPKSKGLKPETQWWIARSPKMANHRGCSYMCWLISIGFWKSTFQGCI